LKIGETLKGKIEKLTDKGWGVLNSPAGSINIHYAIEGEEIEFRIKEESKGKLWGEILQVISPSKHRVEVKCPIYNSCGGCNLLHINYKHQLKYKKEILKKNIDSFFNFSEKDINIISSPPFNYRLRAKLKGREDGKIGFIEKGKTSVIKIEECLLYHKRINNFIRKWNESDKMPFIHQVDLFYNLTEEHLYAYLSENPLSNFPYDFFEKTTFSYKGKEEDSISEIKVKDFKYKVSPVSFFQSNIFLLEKMLETVDSYIEQGDTAIDLYSGIGFFIPVLKNKFKKIYAVESNKFSFKLLKENFPDIKAYRIVSSNFSFPPADLILLDPPRSGVDERTMKRIVKKGYKKIIYISCSQRGFSKDSKILSENNYSLKKLSLLDLFPHTPYFETIALFEL